MRKTLALVAVAVAATLGAAPAHAAAATVTYNESCPAGYNEHVKVSWGGHTVRFCSIP